MGIQGRGKEQDEPLYPGAQQANCEAETWREEACSQVAKSPVEVLSSAALLVQHRGDVHVLPVGGVQKGGLSTAGL